MQDTNESKAGESKEFLRIERNETAQVLMNLSKQKMLAPFFAQAITVQAAATRTGVSTLVMFRHVKRFEALGLLRVTKKEARRGRALKYYQTTAKTFFIPARVFALEHTLEAVSRDSQQLFLHNLVRTILQHQDSEDIGTQISLSVTGTGVVATQLALGPGHLWGPTETDSAAIAELWLNLRLGHEEAKELQHELAGLAERYAQKSGEQKYLLRLGLTPTE
jgi:hypothetical protein